jgi:capsular polysaccharide biosynthesis protein
MTEVLSRLWGWPLAKEQIPELKAIFRIRYEDERDPVLEKLLFGAFGIAEEDIVWAHEPVTLDGLVGATPMWHNQFVHFAHPEIRTRVWEPITRALAGDRPGGNERLFVSRRRNTGMNRLCRDADQIEATFAAHGFDILYPEDHSLEDQAALFRAARVVAGFGGSAMFNLMHCRQLDQVIVLNSEGYIARNEHLYAAVHGARADYFWGVPDVAADRGSWTQAAYTSPWRLDFERNGAALDKVLRDLG